MTRRVDGCECVSSSDRICSWVAFSHPRWQSRFVGSANLTWNLIDLCELANLDNHYLLGWWPRVYFSDSRTHLQNLCDDQPSSRSKFAAAIVSSGPRSTLCVFAPSHGNDGMAWASLLWTCSPCVRILCIPYSHSTSSLHLAYLIFPTTPVSPLSRLGHLTSRRRLVGDSSRCLAVWPVSSRGNHDVNHVIQIE